MSRLPRRPEAHGIADAGLSKVSFIFHQWGWVSDKISSDYGEDLDCIIFVENRRTNLHFRCQIKSFKTGSYVRRLKSGNFSISIKTSTAKSWIKCYYPILLIIYDVENDKTYWTNASKQIWSNFTKLSQISMVINIEKSMTLEESKSKIIYDVQTFYESLLRISNPMLESTIYPILMPGYRSLSYFDISENIKSIKQNELKVDFESSTIEHMPSWATSIQTLFHDQLHGLKIQKSTNEIESFIQNLEEYLQKIQIPKEENEWISFICSPILLKSAEEDTMDAIKNTIWTRELTGWWNYSLMDEKIISDLVYNFAAPEGLLHPIARHGRSWDNFYYLDMQNDIAVEFYASIVTTEGYKKSISIHRKHFLSQFIPWICPLDEIDTLNKLLLSEELIFNVIDDLSKNTHEKIGIISTPFFNPIIGIFSMAKNWKEFSYNTVLDRLEKSCLFDKIPGRRGPEKVKEYIISIMDGLDEPPDYIIIRNPDYVPGLPLLHNERIISVERHQYSPEIEEESVKEKLENCCKKIRLLVQNPNGVFFDFNIIDEYNGRLIYRIGINWKPDLKESSVESFNKFKNLIIETFNKIMPSKKDDKENLSNTYTIIHFIGLIHYEGDPLNDIPWGFGIVGDKIVSFSGKIRKNKK